MEIYRSSSFAAFIAGSINGVTIGDVTPSSGVFTTLRANTSLFLPDNISLMLGNSSASPDARILWSTDDANANALLFALPAGGAINVPVAIFGDNTALSLDLGLFNGITDPSVAVLSNDATKAIRMYHDGTNGFLAVTSGSIKFSNALILSGNVFVDTQFIALSINKPIYFDTGGKNGIKVNTSQTPDTMSIGLDGSGTYARNLFIEESQDWGYDRAIASPTNPTLSIWSANQSQTERIYFYHDQTKGVISSGAGGVNVATRFHETQGADVASANDLTLGLDGNVFEITGAVQINAITTATWLNGSQITLLFTSTPTVKNNTAGGAGTAVLLLDGGADFVASAGDTLTLVLSEIGGTQAWREIGRTAL